MRYFGTDPDAALAKYLDQRDDLQAGRTPRTKSDELTVRDLANRFLTSKKTLLGSGELSPRTWGHYYLTCEILVGAFGKARRRRTPPRHARTRRLNDRQPASVELRVCKKASCRRVNASPGAEGDMDRAATEPDGEELLAAARAAPADGAAVGRLLETYRAYLTLLARVQIGRRLRGKADAADLVQQTFLEACRGFDQFQGTTERTFLAWLRRILAAQLARLVRRYCGTAGRDVNLERELDDSSDRLDRGLFDAGDSPSGAASRREQALVLADALEQLPADYREVIVLRQLEGLSFNEVADRLGRSLDAVQKLWVRGLDQLRRLIEGSD